MFPSGLKKMSQNASKEYVYGEKGHLSHKSTGKSPSSSLLNFSDALQRNSDEKTIKDKLNACIEQKVPIKKVIITCFAARNCRGGKGERKVFYNALAHMYKIFPTLVLKLISLIPQYGYWKDLLNMLEFVKEVNFRKTICKLFANQLRKDFMFVASADENKVPYIRFLCTKFKNVTSDQKISLCSKWAPSEGKVFDKKYDIVSDIIKEMFNIKVINRSHKKMYRKMNVYIRKYLDIVEAKMSADEFASIIPKNIPSMALQKYIKALSNRDKNGDIIYDIEDREECRENVLAFIANGGKINGKQLFPHELVKSCLGVELDKFKQTVLNAQFADIIRNVKKQIAENKVESHIDFTKALSVCDVSGSMEGIPIRVAIGLTLVVSQLTHKDYRDLAITFHENPTVHHFADCKTMYEKIKSLEGADWGGSTDFEKTMCLITKIIREKKLPESEIPTTLFVFSDMQFDAAHRYDYGSANENILKMFEELGVEMYGHPIKPPTIVFWNLRANTVGYPAKATDKGVVMMQGFSPSMLRYIFSGQTVKSDGTKKTPVEVLETIIADPMYDIIRNVVKEHFNL